MANVTIEAFAPYVDIAIKMSTNVAAKTTSLEKIVNMIIGNMARDFGTMIMILFLKAFE